MKLKSLLTAVCLLGATAASAEIPAYTVTPAAGNVMTLSSVSVTFTDAQTITLATLTYANGPRVVDSNNTAAAFCFKPEVEGNTINCPLNKTIENKGTYNFMLPKGLLTIDGTEVEEDIVITYNVGEEPVPEPSDAFTVTPAQGKVSLLSEIVITFNNVSQVTLGTLSYGNAPRLVKEGTDPTISSNCNFVFLPAIEGATLYLPLNKEESNPGTYNFYLNKSLVSLDGEPMAEDIVLTYTIPAPEYKFTAADENVLAEISSLTFAIDTDSELALKNADAKLTLENTFNKETYEGTASIVDNKLVVAFEPTITAPAPYQITIPEGFFTVAGVANNRAWTFDYRIKGTGEYTVSIEPEEGTVADLSKFVITIEGSPLALGSLDTAYSPQILNANNSAVGSRMEAAISGQTITLTLENEIQKAGEYTLLIPRGLIKLNGENPTNDLRFKYSVDPTWGAVTTLTPDAATAEYFNLQGVRISQPVKGFYIKKTADKIEKIIIK